MSHARTTIRNNFKAAITGLSVTGSNVYGPEVNLYEEVPGLQLFTSGEELDDDPEKAGSRYQERRLEMRVNGAVKMSGDCDAQLDIISAEVETAVFAALNDGSLGNVFDLRLVGSEKTFENELEKKVAIIEMLFECHYMTLEGAPQTAI